MVGERGHVVLLQCGMGERRSVMLSWIGIARRGRHMTLGAQILMGISSIALVVSVVSTIMIRDNETAFFKEVLTTEYQRRFELLHAGLIETVVSEDIPAIETAMKSLLKLQ